MVRTVQRHTSATYGVLDPLVHQRDDTKFLQASLSEGLNLTLKPQGGWGWHGGTRRVSRARRPLVETQLQLAGLTTPNGGDPAALLSTAGFVTNAVAGNTFVVFTCNMGKVQPVSAIDINGFSAAAGRDQCLRIEYQTSAGFWKTFAQTFDLKTTARNRRFANAPAQSQLSFRAFRLIITGGAGPGAVTLAGKVRVWSESRAPGKWRPRRYSPAIDRYYMLVLGENNIDIFRADTRTWVAAVYYEGKSALVPEIKLTPSYDTVLLFHQLMAPQRVMRQGADDEWNFDRVPFSNLPRVDYGGVYANGVNEVQELQFFGMGAGDSYTVTVEGIKSIKANFDGTDAVFQAAQLKAAVESCSNIKPGINCWGEGQNSGLGFGAVANDRIQVEFAGPNGGRDWLQITALANANDDFIAVTTLREGQKAGEDAISDSVGWPAFGFFSDERLIMGGLLNRQSSYMMSVAGDPFNFDTSLPGASNGMMFDINDDNVGTLRDFLNLQRPVFFTDNAIWHLGNDTLDATQAPQRRKSPIGGIKSDCRPIATDNAVYYVQRGGKVMRRIQYSELAQNFTADNASVLSAFLVNDPVDTASRNSTQAADADVIYTHNSDGTMVSLTLMASQDIAGFMPHKTYGKYAGIDVDLGNIPWVIVDRPFPETEESWLEVWDDDIFLDHQFDLVSADPVTSFAVPVEYEGQALHVIADGTYIGQIAAKDCAIELSEPASKIEVGFWVAPVAVDHIYQPENDSKQPFPRMKRVFAVRLAVKDTNSVAVVCNDGPVYDMPIDVLNDTTLTTPGMQRLFTGTLAAEGFAGHTEDAKVKITQVRPGPMLILALKKEIAA